MFNKVSLFILITLVFFSSIIAFPQITQSQNLSLEEVRDMLTIQWDGSPVGGTPVPAKLQTGIKPINDYENPIFNVQTPSGQTVQASYFENYVAVSPSIFYSSDLLDDEYYLLFVLERENGAMIHNIATIPISTQYEFQPNIIQFFSTVQNTGANILDRQTNGIHAEARPANNQGFPEETMYVRAYLNGGGFLNQLYDEYELGVYFEGDSAISHIEPVHIETIGASPLETTPIQDGESPVSTEITGNEDLSQENLVPMTTWRLQSFKTDWDIDHYEHELGGYVYDGWVRSQMTNMGSGTIDFIVSPTVVVPQFQPSGIRSIQFDGGNEFQGNSTAVISFENYDDAEQETPILVPDRDVYMAVLYNNTVRSFRRVQNFQQPETLIDVTVDRGSGARIVYYDETTSTPKIGIVLSIDSQVDINTIEVSLNADWGQGVLIDSFEMNASERVVQYNFDGIIESAQGNTVVQADMPYYLTIFADGVLIAGDYLGKVEFYETMVPATTSGTTSTAVTSGTGGQNTQSGAFSESSSSGTTAGGVSTQQTGNTNIGNPQVGALGTGGIEAPSMSISDAGIIPCGRRYGPNDTSVPCNFNHVVILIQNLISFAFVLIMPIAAIVFMYAGFLFITGGSSPDKRTKARGIFGKAFMGILFVMAAWLIVSLVLQMLGVPEPFRLLDF